MMQTDAINYGTGIIGIANLLLLLRLSFGAGKVVQQTDTHEKMLEHHEGRLERLEQNSCTASADCPLRRKE